MNKHSWCIFGNYYLETELKLDDFGYGGYKIMKIIYRVFRCDKHDFICLGNFAYLDFDMKYVDKEKLMDKIRDIIIDDLVMLYTKTGNRYYLTQMMKLQEVKYDEI